MMRILLLRYSSIEPNITNKQTNINTKHANLSFLTLYLGMCIQLILEIQKVNTYDFLRAYSSARTSSMEEHLFKNRPYQHIWAIRPQVSS